jgi:hypothetical protein
MAMIAAQFKRLAKLGYDDTITQITAERNILYAELVKLLADQFTATGDTEERAVAQARALVDTKLGWNQSK